MNRTSLLLRMSMLLATLPLAAHAQDATRPTHGYRVTYTLITTDAGKRSGAEYFSMTVSTSAPSAQDSHSNTGHGQLKIGQKVPVSTGAFNDGKSGIQTQFQYLDVGTSIDATVTESPSGLQIVSKLEQSSVAPQPVVIAGVSEPVIRQIVLANSSTITLGKVVRVGSLDLPDTQRHVDVEVKVELLD